MMDGSWKYGFVIPVYNHGAALEGVVRNLVQYDFPIIVVDDGNDERNKTFINDIAARYPLVSLVVRAKNGGKGAAMKDGVRRAHELGLTHILQLDSDGQHDTSRIPHFLTLSQENPGAIICGCPEYDENAPRHRVNGRKVANAWIHFVTLSKCIEDGMIGFRVYPVEPYMKQIQSHAILDNRMGYDIEILVRLYWRGIQVISSPVKVFYPADGVSNFRNVRDNIRIAGSYARLCIGLVPHLPVLLARKCRKIRRETPDGSE